MNTTRRALVSSCGIGTLALLAGCLGGSDGSDGDDTETPDETLSPGGTDNETGGTRPRGTGGPGVTIVSRDGDPDAPVRPTVEVTEEAATEEHPPVLTATVTNESDRAVTIGEGRDVVFAYRSDTDDQLILLPTDGDYPAEAGCWRLAEQIAVTEEYRMVTLEPGESTSQELGLYALPGEDACLPVGEYRFESSYAVMDEPDGERQNSFTWGFSVLLE
ncbi:hypothetical protein [Halogeometricum limi]|uniref:hypothetical protein n=1 Tax=Halogeometricum limi TaxID=555875 RepID=UPI000B7E819F|nr:hypothetical protein [Halogeometricum limi]